MTSNTRRDGEEFLALAVRLAIHVHPHIYAFDAAEQALQHVAEGRGGAAVLSLGEGL